MSFLNVKLPRVRIPSINLDPKKFVDNTVNAVNAITVDPILQGTKEIGNSLDAGVKDVGNWIEHSIDAVIESTQEDLVSTAQAVGNAAGSLTKGLIGELFGKNAIRNISIAAGGYMAVKLYMEYQSKDKEQKA